MESSTIVIKVKYGEILRRFTSRVSGNELGLDMGGLREKVLDLFNFAPDSDLTLTYIDEDGDIVTLVDEEDLHDVMRQSLNPLRITVKLNSMKIGRSYARSSGSSTPMRSPRVQHPLPKLDAGVAEILKSIPEPFREVFSKMSLDLVPKATSSAPGLAELVERFSRMGQSDPNPVSEPDISAGFSSSMSKDPKVSKDDVTTSEALPNMKLEEQTSKNNMDNGNVTVDVGTSAAPVLDSMDLALPDVQVPVQFHFALENQEAAKKLGDPHINGKVVGSAPHDLTSIDPRGPVDDNAKDVKRLGRRHLGLRRTGVDASTSSTESKTADLGGGISMQCPSVFPNPSSSHAAPKLFTNCPFTVPPHFANDSTATHTHFAPRLHPFKRSYIHGDGMGSVFHRGVGCDGCGIHPITGPRFKSKVKEDYDLCSICFGKMGNEAEYIRLDRPVSYRLSRSFKGLHDTMQQPWVRPPPLPHVLRGCAVKSKGPKLESRFIKDINVLDGTVVAPLTKFTKIWRMRNSGGVVWPQGTQLVWIGGDKLCEILSVGLEISVDGLPAEHELDVAVDFTAPELPGRYISYWRMASPSGQKFGQRVWVLIQVEVPAPKDSFGDSLQGLNLNLPPVTNNTTGPEIINISAEPIAVPQATIPVVDQNRNEDPELSFPINDTLLVGGGFPVSAPPPVAASSSSSSVSYPIIDLSEVVASAPYDASSPIVDVPKTAQGNIESNHVEETLLRELEEMGFKQVDLNKEVLRMNEYDLAQSVDDLCGVAEWDPILEELQEMGFSDKEMNKKLLKKNNGSIKRVVMDLITGEKA